MRSVGLGWEYRATEPPPPILRRWWPLHLHCSLSVRYPGEEMAQAAVEGAEEGAGGWQPKKKGQERETNFSSISEVKPTAEPNLLQRGDAAGVIDAGGRAREETVRTYSDGGHEELVNSSPLKEGADLSPTGRRSPYHDEVGELLGDVADGEHNWDTIPNEPASPALLGVHRIAVEVMRRSFGSADGDPGT